MRKIVILDFVEKRRFWRVLLQITSFKQFWGKRWYIKVVQRLKKCFQSHLFPKKIMGKNMIFCQFAKVRVIAIGRIWNLRCIVRFFSKIFKLEKKIYNFCFTKNFVTTRVGLKIAVKFWTKVFFSKRRIFSKFWLNLRFLAYIFDFSVGIWWF